MFSGEEDEKVKELMRNLPDVKVIVDGSPQHGDGVSLKRWKAEANSEDLHALYKGEIENKTHFKFHDLLFNVSYEDVSSRFFRQELLINFRELIAGTITVEDISAQAERVAEEEEQAKIAVKEMIRQLREQKRNS